MKNRCSEFSIPIIATATATVVRNGSINRVSSVVSSSLPGTAGELSPRCHGVGDWAGEEDAEDDEDASDHEQGVDDEIAEPPGALAALRGQGGRERRHERSRHRPFGEQIPQKIRHPECDVERVHFGPARRTEDRGQHRFARDTKDAARHRGDADQARRSGHSRAHLVREKAVGTSGTRQARVLIRRSAYHTGSAPHFSGTKTPVRIRERRTMSCANAGHR